MSLPAYNNRCGPARVRALLFPAALIPPPDDVLESRESVPFAWEVSLLGLEEAGGCLFE